MWIQPVDPLNDLVSSSLVAAIPIVVLGVLLLSRKVVGYAACIITLALAVILAISVYHMPVQLASLAALYGALSGLLPIGWIVLAAVFLYNLSVRSGSFAVVRASIETVTADRRIQALLIAFCFGAFLEGSAGFGAPVAITAGMLMGLGFESISAASLCLLANTAPVAFGGIGIAVVTAGQLTGIDPGVLSRMIGHQLPFISLIIPLWLVVLIAGWRGARAVWPAIAVCGIAYSTTMYLTASYLGPALPDVLSSIVSLIALAVLLRFWRPREIWRFPHETGHQPAKAPAIAWPLLLKAWTPFLLLIIFIANWAFAGTQAVLNQFTIKIPFGALSHAIVANGGHLVTVNYNFVWLSAAGTAILLAALLSAVLLRLSPGLVWVVARETLAELRRPLITIAAIVGFAYVANFSGMSATLSHALAGTGHWFPFIAPLLGWLGVFMTGSDTSSNALFSGLQASTARSLDLNPVLTVAANTSGGVAAKMISPQSIAVAAAATKLTNQEGVLFRRTILHSLAIVGLVAVLTYLQAYYLPGMVPAPAPLVTASAAHFGWVDWTVVTVSVVGLAIVSWLAVRGPALPRPQATRA